MYYSIVTLLRVVEGYSYSSTYVQIGPKLSALSLVKGCVQSGCNQQQGCLRRLTLYCDHIVYV